MPVKYSDIDVEKIVYNKTPKQHENEKHTYVGMFYPTEEEHKYNKLVFFSPKLKCSVTNNYVHLHIPPVQKKDNFFKFILAVDDMNVNTALEHKEMWLSEGDTATLDDVQEQYRYSVKVGDASQDGRVLSLKIPRRHTEGGKNEVTTKVYTHTKEKCDLSAVEDGSEVVALVELERLVFSKHSFKAEWIVHQLKLSAPAPEQPEKEEPDQAEAVEQEPEKAPSRPSTPKVTFEETFGNSNDDVLDYDDDSE